MPLHLLDSLYDKMLSRLGLALLALALLINLGALIAIDKSIGALDESRKQAIKSQNVLVELASVQSLLFEAESGQWGFLSSGKAAYLNALRANEPKIVARLSGLRNLVAGSPTQLELIE